MITPQRSFRLMFGMDHWWGWHVLQQLRLNMLVLMVMDVKRKKEIMNVMAKIMEHRLYHHL